MKPCGNCSPPWKNCCARLVGHPPYNSGDPQPLVGLQAQAPLRMGQTIGDGGLGVSLPLGSVQRLQEEMLERQIHEAFRLRFGFGLRVNQLQLVASAVATARSPWG